MALRMSMGEEQNRRAREQERDAQNAADHMETITEEGQTSNQNQQNGGSSGDGSGSKQPRVEDDKPDGHCGCAYAAWLSHSILDLGHSVGVRPRDGELCRN